MKQEEVLGRIVRNKITLKEGLCIGTLDWIFGCRIYLACPRTKNAEGDDKYDDREIQIPEPCIEIVDTTPAIDAGFPKEEEPKFFGKICRDKVTGYEGMCIGRFWTFYAEKEYCIQGKYSKKKLRKPSAMWIDEGRVEVLQSEDTIEPEEVQSEYRGGCIDIAIPGRYLSRAESLSL